MEELTTDDLAAALDDSDQVVWVRLRYERGRARFEAARKALLALGAEYAYWLGAWRVPDDVDVATLLRLYRRTSAVIYSAHRLEHLTKDHFL